MQKVVFSVSRKNRDEKLKGIGYLVEGNLLIPATSSKGKPYIRVFEDITEQCKPVSEDSTEFKGYIDVIYTDVPVFKSVDHDSDETKEGSYEVLESVTVTYYIWFRHLDWEGGDEKWISVKIAFYMEDAAEVVMIQTQRSTHLKEKTTTTT